MSSVKRICHIFDRPGVYEIRIAGSVDEQWSDRLGGMVVCSVPPMGPQDVPTTVLTGWLPDQVALNGVLNTLYDLQLALRSVTLVSFEE